MARIKAAFLQSENEVLEVEIDERVRAQQELEDTLKALQNTQQELIQKEKLASLGGLMSEIAKRIIPPTEVLQAWVDDLERDMPVWGRMHRPKDILSKAALTRSLSPLLEASEAIKQQSQKVAETIALLKDLLQEEQMPSNMPKAVVGIAQGLD